MQCISLDLIFRIRKMIPCFIFSLPMSIKFFSFNKRNISHNTPQISPVIRSIGGGIIMMILGGCTPTQEECSKVENMVSTPAQTSDMTAENVNTFYRCQKQIDPCTAIIANANARMLSETEFSDWARYCRIPKDNKECLVYNNGEILKIPCKDIRTRH